MEKTKGVIFMKHRIYHRLRGSASPVVRVTSHFNGNSKIWPLVFPKPLNFSTPKFAQMIMSSISPDVQNLAKIRSRGGFPTNRWNITLAWLFVPSLPFFSCRPLQEKRLAHMTRFDARKCLLGVTKFKFNISTYFFAKIWKITMAPMGKVRQCFKLWLCIR